MRVPPGPPAAVSIAALRHLVAATGKAAVVAALAAGLLWRIDVWRVRAAARARTEVWGRGVSAWDQVLEDPVPDRRDSAVVALETLAERGVIAPIARVRLSRHLAARLGDAAPTTRMLAVLAALQMAEGNGAATHALRAAAAGVLTRAASAPARVAALEVLVRIGAAPDDLDVARRVAQVDADPDTRALAAAAVGAVSFH